MPGPLPSPKSRLRPVYRVPNEEPGPERVIYQLEDQGDPVLRLRATVREVDEDGLTRFLYRVSAFSRMTGRPLGTAELLASLGSEEEFAARSRAFQSGPFEVLLAKLSEDLRSRYSTAEAEPEKPA